jgi:hypothetical protein
MPHASAGRGGRPPAQPEQAQGDPSEAPVGDGSRAGVSAGNWATNSPPKPPVHRLVGSGRSGQGSTL